MEVQDQKQQKMYTKKDLIGKGGKFLVLTALDTDIFCREKFTTEQDMMAGAALEYAKNQLKPISDKLSNVLDEKLSRKIFREVGELGFLGVVVYTLVHTPLF